MSTAPHNPVSGERWHETHLVHNGGTPPTHGMSLTPEYKAWKEARRRTTKPTDAAWRNYGGRGIRFLFESFEQFFAELGPRPEGLTLDRIDNDGNYEPGNVRWATPSQQRRNQRANAAIARQSPAE